MTMLIGPMDLYISRSQAIEGTRVCLGVGQSILVPSGRNRDLALISI
jgi:hypothetical protein